MSAPAVTGREFARLEGCDEKQVRRAVAKGLLKADAEGKLDPTQVGSGWRKPRRDSKEMSAKVVADKRADIPKLSAAMSAPPPPPSPSPSPPPMDRDYEDGDGDVIDLKRAIAHKEEFTGRLKELEFRQKAKQLISVELARQVLFDEFRASRDAWLNWPTRFAALIATDLGMEQADRVAEVLTSYVHKQLTSLGEPGGEFSEG